MSILSTSTTRRARRLALGAAALATLATVTTVAGTGSAWAADPAPPRAVVVTSRPFDSSSGYFHHEVDVSVDIVPGDLPLDVSASKVWVIHHDLSVTGFDEPRTSLEISVADEGWTEIEWDVVDSGNNHAAGAVFIKMDSIDPIVTPVDLPEDGATLPWRSDLRVDLSCQDDGDWQYASGIAPGACGYSAGTVGDALDTSVPGPLTVTAFARDVAGNVTTVTRHYTVSGPPGRPRVITRPDVVDGPFSGGVLGSHTGTWTGVPTAYRYQWLRDGVPIEGATGATYASGPSDARHWFRVRVTAVNAVGERTAVSLPVKVGTFHPGG